MKTQFMRNIAFSKKDDDKGIENPKGSLDLTPFVGKWENTKEGSGQLPYVELREENGALYLRAFGAGESALIDWGESACEVFAENIYDGTAIAFMASFHLSGIEVDITANVKLGVLVVQTYTRFKDGSDRLNYYAREFYGPAQ